MSVPEIHLQRKKTMVWELAYAGWGGHEVFLHLSAGWEPFQITQTETDIGTQYLVWFRRQVPA